MKQSPVALSLAMEASLWLGFAVSQPGWARPAREKESSILPLTISERQPNRLLRGSDACTHKNPSHLEISIIPQKKEL